MENSTKELYNTFIRTKWILVFHIKVSFVNESVSIPFNILNLNTKHLI